MADVTCVATITAMSESLILYVNETTLFFHNRRFETPETKKNVSSRIKTWAQGVPPPAQVQHLAKRLKPSTASQRSISTSTSSTFNQGASGTHTCAVVTSSTTTAFQNKPSLKRQHLDSDDPDISKLNMPSTAYGGLEDDDDSLEQLAALISPLKAPIAVKESKVNAPPLSHLV